MQALLRMRAAVRAAVERSRPVHACDPHGLWDSICRDSRAAAARFGSEHCVTVFRYVAMTLEGLRDALPRAARHFTQRVQTASWQCPESILAIVIGFASSLPLCSAAARPGKDFDTIFFLYLVPPILFESGYSLNQRDFFRNFMAIVLLAVVGTVISSIVAGMGLFYLASAGAFSGINTDSPKVVAVRRTRSRCSRGQRRAMRRSCASVSAVRRKGCCLAHCSRQQTLWRR